MAGTDKPITTLPYFIDTRYGLDNKFKPHTLWYAPPYHVNFAIMQIIGQERILPIFLFNTILCSIIVLITYFVMRKLFGFWPALLSSFLLIFSMRDILIYLWGQWPQQIAYFYTPLILYVFYKYAMSYLAQKEKPIYIYIMSILLAINFFFHPASFFHTIVALFVFTILLFIKERKVIFNVKNMSIAIIIFLFIIAIFPYQTANVFAKSTGGKSSSNPYIGDFSRLFHWFGMQDYYTGQPREYFSYTAMHKIWTLPLLLLGIFFLLIRRRKKDLLLLSYLISVYLMVHLIFIGFGRPERSLAASSHIFYPIIALGLLAIPSFLIIKIPLSLRKNIKYILIILFFVLALTYNFKPAYNQLKEAYSGIIRVTPVQYETAEWLKENIPENSNVSTVGVLIMQKDRWIRYISWRYVHAYKDTGPRPSHMLFDYSDFMAIGDTNQIEQVALFEKQIMENNTLVYNKNNIKVYKLENKE